MTSALRKLALALLGAWATLTPARADTIYAMVRCDNRVPTPKGEWYCQIDPGFVFNDLAVCESNAKMQTFVMYKDGPEYKSYCVKKTTPSWEPVE